MAKQKQRDYAAELQERFDRWDELKTNGGRDPLYTDGDNMHLVRNHIIYLKSEIEKNMNPDGYPEAYYRETPPEVDRGYMARADEIRVNAMRSLEAYKADKDYRWLLNIADSLTPQEKRGTYIDNVLWYVEGLEKAINENRLVDMRRHENAEWYLGSFPECAEKVKEAISKANDELKTKNVQLSLFA